MHLGDTALHIGGPHLRRYDRSEVSASRYRRHLAMNAVMSSSRLLRGAVCEWRDCTPSRATPVPLSVLSEMRLGWCSRSGAAANIRKPLREYWRMLA